MSLQYRKGECTACPEGEGKDKYIVKRIGADKYCDPCNRKRLESRRGPKVHAPLKRTALKKSQKPIKRSPIKWKRKATGEGVLFETIWNTRKHVSFLNGKSLGDDAYAWYFVHVLRKAAGHFPKFKLYDKNIILLTRSQHDMYDKHVRNPEYLIGLDPRWKNVFELRDELLVEYEKL